MTAVFTNAQPSYPSSAATLAGGVSVARAATTTTLTGPAEPVAAGLPATFVATVATVAPGGGTPAGSVVFQSGSTVWATVPLSVVNGADQASYTVPALAAGTVPVTATYANSDGNDLGSASTTDQIVYAPGTYAVGSQLIVVGGVNTSDDIQIEPAGSESNGSTGVTVSATINGNRSTTTFAQSLTSVNDRRRQRQ